MKKGHKLKVFFTGGEGVNWALDHDLVHMRRLTKAYVEEVDSIRKADVVHSVWWRGLIFRPYEDLIGKTVIASIADSPKIVMGTPDFLKVRKKVTAWLCEYDQSVDYMNSCRLPVLHLPDAIGLSDFYPSREPLTDKKALKQRLGIENDRYVIGNFFRDSSMSDLDKPKKQKGADLFLEIATQLVRKGLPVHFLLAGPRRHWLIKHFKDRGIPYSYIGEEVPSDDIEKNTLDLKEVSNLYRAIDLYLIPSRWEGAPNAVLEAAACKTKVLSTEVGQSPDILSPIQIYKNVTSGVELVERDIKDNFLANHLDAAYDNIIKWNSYEAMSRRVKHLYYQALEMPKVGNREGRKWISIPERYGRKVMRRMRHVWHKPLFDFNKLTVSLWHDFQPPPYGGGNQFMLALESEMQSRGIKVQRNSGKGADLQILQSIWFDLKKFKRELSPSSFVLHRIDGPIQLYRGEEFKKDDDYCYQLNKEIADATIMQTAWSYRNTRELGYDPLNPVIVKNGVDPSIFFSKEKRGLNKAEKIKLISTSWSNNPRKGKEVYQYIDQHVDFERFEYTFVGRITEGFKNIKVIEPVDSLRLAEIIREHDLYVTASRKDPCSNALTEALSCGLPALYYNDGGHPEIVEYGGLSFNKKEEIPEKLDQLVTHYDSYQNLIWVNSMEEVVDLYLETFKASLSN